MPEWLGKLVEASPIAASILAGLFLLTRSLDQIIKVLGNHVVHALDNLSEKIDSLAEHTRYLAPDIGREVRAAIREERPPIVIPPQHVTVQTGGIDPRGKE